MIAQRIKNNNAGKNSALGRITTTLYMKKLEKQGYCMLNLAEEGSEELKSKAPKLYAKIYQQGKEDGSVQARESAEISARVKARMNETKKIAEENSLANKKDFKTLMNEYQAEHECTKLEALKACGKLYPDEFKAGKEGMKAIAGSHPEEHKKHIEA